MNEEQENPNQILESGQREAEDATKIFNEGVKEVIKGEE